MNNPVHSKPCSAFSLVEVVMALGIATFAIVSMVGLLSVGFRGARDSINMTVVSDIAQTLSGEAQLTPWTNLAASYGASTRYFDDMGKEVDTQTEAVFIARTSLAAPTSLVSAGAHATNLQIEIRAISTPQTNLASRLLVRSE